MLLGTRHAKADVSDREDKKPVIVLDYNHNKGGMDNLDKEGDNYQSFQSIYEQSVLR